MVATSDKAFLGDGPCDKSSPLYVVGARTGRAAQARGWRLAAPPAPHAAELIERLTSALRANASVLYLAGRDRKGAIEAALSGTFALETVEAYAAEARLSWRPREARALASCVAALHYSRRSAALAAELAKVSGEAERFRELRHFCLSGDVAEPLKALGAARIAVAETPDEAGLFRAVMPRPARVSFPWDLPYIRPRKIEGREAMVDEETQDVAARRAGAPVNRDARPDPGVIEGEIAARNAREVGPSPRRGRGGNERRP